MGRRWGGIRMNQGAASIRKRFTSSQTNNFLDCVQNRRGAAGGLRRSRRRRNVVALGGGSFDFHRRRNEEQRSVQDVGGSHPVQQNLPEQRGAAEQEPAETGTKTGAGAGLATTSPPAGVARKRRFFSSRGAWTSPPGRFFSSWGISPRRGRRSSSSWGRFSCPQKTSAAVTAAHPPEGGGNGGVLQRGGNGGLLQRRRWRSRTTPTKSTVEYVGCVYAVTK